MTTHICPIWPPRTKVSVFQQPPIERNALHEYLDNEDAAINSVASDGGGYATAQEGWGAGGQAGNGQSQKVEEDDEDMEVGRSGDAVR